MYPKALSAPGDGCCLAECASLPQMLFLLECGTRSLHLPNKIDRSRSRLCTRCEKLWCSSHLSDLCALRRLLIALHVKKNAETFWRLSGWPIGRTHRGQSPRTWLGDLHRPFATNRFFLVAPGSLTCKDCYVHSLATGAGVCIAISKGLLNTVV